MNKYILSLFAMVCVSYVSSAQDTARRLPEEHWARARKIDVRHLSIDLQFDWQKRQAFGTTAITLAPLDATQDIALDAGMLTISSISVNKVPLTFLYDGSDKDDALKIKLDRIYRPGEELTLTIAYRTSHINETDPLNLGGSNGKGGLRFIWPTPVEPKRKKQIWSLGEPESNRYWFPGYDYPNDFRTTDIKLTVEKSLTAVANGRLLERKSNADGTITFHFREDVPYANQNTSFVVGEYADVKQDYNNIPLHSYSYTNEVEATTASVERLPDMVKFFSEYTGVNYPFASYSQVFVQDLPWGAAGMGIAAQSENMVDDYYTHADYLYLWDPLEGESLAWQWTGCYVTPADWSQQWLGKGLSRYFSGLYNMYKNGTDEFLIWQHALADQAIYLADWNAGLCEPVVTKNYSGVGGNAPYYYGASVMRMLHKHVGDEKWKQILKTYFSTNAHKPVTTEDFRKAIEQVTGDPMEWFFDQWVYRVGHPVFEVTKQYDKSSKQLILTVTQKQKPDSLGIYPHAEFFQGKVEIEIDDAIETVWLNAQEENVFSFPISQEPKLVNFDYQSTWLKELIFKKTTEELLYIALNSSDILARRSAITELGARARSEFAVTAMKTDFMNALREIVQSTAYWRLRMSALGQLRGLLVTPGTPAKLDPVSTKMLLNMIAKEKSWVKATAIAFLGTTQDPKYTNVYINALADNSDRVVANAAVALGGTKSPKAYAALAKLVTRPSWKNQSLMSALNGLQQLGDPRAYDIAYRALSDLNEPRWNLPQASTSVWDYRVIAVQTIAGLKRSADAYPLIFDRLKKSLQEEDLNVIFNNVLLIETLAEPKGKEIYPLLRERFKDDKAMLEIVDQYETQFNQAIGQ
ncbi:MAG: HEAT repeat domain-containing protein [Cyclobacteriaceae bacterium]|nr:HEAT repeat domain-containing protein [Cyclobacteriaceae bacterium]